MREPNMAPKTDALALVPKTKPRKLKDVQDVVAEQLAAGVPAEEIAAAVGLPLSTLSCQLDVGYVSPMSTEVQQNWNGRRFLRHAVHRNRLEALASQAVGTLEAAMAQGDVRAAAIVLRAAGLDTPDAHPRSH